MIDTLAKIGPLATSCVTAVIAYLVYRLSADKLFHDMLVARREAAREFLDAAQFRFNETIGLTAGKMESSRFELPGQTRFWRAEDAVNGLCGAEVLASTKRLDDALAAVTSARLQLEEGAYEPHEKQTRLFAHMKAVAEFHAATRDFANIVKPYVILGRRGLPLAQRLRLSGMPSKVLKRNRAGLGLAAVTFLVFLGASLRMGEVSVGVDERANRRRCQAVQSDMLAAQPRRQDDTALFEALGCRPQGEGSVYGKPTQRELRAGHALPDGEH